MKRTILVLELAVFVAVSSGVLIVEALANPSSYVRLFDNVVIRVQSPQNRTYAERNIPLNFTVETNNEEQLKTRYVLNNGKPVDVATPVVSTRTETGWYGDGSAERNYTFNYPRYTAQGTAVLLNLSDGTCNLTIQRYIPDPIKPESVRIINATTVTFTVGVPPPVTQFPSLENSDGSAPSPETGGGLAPRWLPYIEVAVILAVVAVVAAGVLIYWKKQEHKAEPI